MVLLPIHLCSIRVRKWVQDKKKCQLQESEKKKKKTRISSDHN